MAQKPKPYYQILRDCREDWDLSQREIAALLYVSQSVYSGYERGVNALPIHSLIVLCKFYNLSSDYVLGLKREPRNL